MVIVDLLAMFVFGISGGLTAVRMRLDIVGVAVLGTVTGLGGGWLRDVLIGDVPPPGLSDWRYLTAALLGGLITFFLHPAINRLQPLINVFVRSGWGCSASPVRSRRPSTVWARCPPRSSDWSPEWAEA